MGYIRLWKKPFLVQKLNADVMSESLSQTPIVPEHATASASAVIWDESSMEVVRFVHETKEGLEAEHLSRSYSLPKQVNITAESLNPGIYKRIMHKLLFVEEGFMKDEISRRSYRACPIPSYLVYKKLEANFRSIGNKCEPFELTVIP
ncbi:hypothetical protein OS493_023608 [Desmophyllum pertusum]|uniref:Uncharacterized protein n=1 Tax=Desmophyllum pertusum TaxID=174260 RepID=A0A9W9ZCX4_9CNID|nr:hypothetical protein OS493_023608 [Desmophyllum pertusum]